MKIKGERVDHSEILSGQTQVLSELVEDSLGMASMDRSAASLSLWLMTRMNSCEAPTSGCQALSILFVNGAAFFCPQTKTLPLSPNPYSFIEAWLNSPSLDFSGPQLSSWYGMYSPVRTWPLPSWTLRNLITYTRSGPLVFCPGEVDTSWYSICLQTACFVSSYSSCSFLLQACVRVITNNHMQSWYQAVLRSLLPNKLVHSFSI